MGNIKELFAEWGLWSLVEDISDDGDGVGDNLQLTKEGSEAQRMIEQLLSERTPSKEDIIGAVARGYTYKVNEDKVLDVDLCKAIVEEISKLLKEKG